MSSPVSHDSPPATGATALKIPFGLPNILREFTREAIRAQPPTLIEFGASYFTDLAAKHHPFAIVWNRVDAEGRSVHALKNGVLSHNETGGDYSVTWTDTTELRCAYATDKRRTHLTEAIVYRGRFLTFDDTTGIVFEVVRGDLVPRHVLSAGTGLSIDRFAVVWAAVKEGMLHMGGHGRESEVDGKTDNTPLFIKTLSEEGTLTHVDWSEAYNALRDATETTSSGYVTHSGCQWSSLSGQWFFLPRRVSKAPYDPETDHEQGGTILISSNEDFLDIRVDRVGISVPCCVVLYPCASCAS
eukprot:TRINITY_DN22059_c0_g1_i1.p1 TRINITY_DN22059_c0_g1~~TRINITY_DN22059_c0_g1_i1.p1  ORF type:complete len:307 (-),score=40.80 TRINITY_DN22059_c0_g1_i1:288-1187(-)